MRSIAVSFPFTRNNHEIMAESMENLFIIWRVCIDGTVTFSDRKRPWILVRLNITMTIDWPEHWKNVSQNQFNEPHRRFCPRKPFQDSLVDIRVYQPTYPSFIYALKTIIISVYSVLIHYRAAHFNRKLVRIGYHCCQRIYIFFSIHPRPHREVRPSSASKRGLEWV